MVNCDRFHDDYSSFRDGVLAPRERVAFQAHLQACAACARYDRAVREGTAVLQRAEPLSVSDDFRARLQHRIWHEELDRLDHGRRTRALGLSSVVGVAAAAAGVALGLSLRPAADASRPAPLPATQARAANGGYGGSIPHPELGRITSELVRLGVRVQELPYHDVVHRRDATLVASLAEYTEGDPSLPLSR